MILSLRGLTKRYPGTVAVDRIDLDLRQGEFVTLLGPSGCGKTTTLRMIAGYTEPTAGQILLDGADITATPPQQRNMGMVFQHYALFPHMTVDENIAFSLRARRWPEDKIKARVQAMLELVRLPDIGRRYPGQLSGGQQQRVALARALVFGPRILLMDEALGALDVKLREHMRNEIKRIQRQLGITTLHVTHDQEEALGMSDRVVVMRHGRVVQVDTPRGLYERPTSAYVADFVGKVNLFPARVVEAGRHGTVLELVGNGLVEGTARRVVASRPTDLPAGARVQVGVRPEYLEIRRQPEAENCVAGRVESVKYIGPLQYVSLQVGAEQDVLALDPSKSEPSDELLYARWDPERTLVLEEE